MKRVAPSIASSFDFSSKTAYPPTTSLASVKGPSIAVTCPRERRMRVLAAVGESPPLSRIVPALTASSLSFAIASISSLGGAPLFSADLTSIMNRMVISPLSLASESNFLGSRQFASWLYLSDTQLSAESTSRFELFNDQDILQNTATRSSRPSARTCPLQRSAEVRTHPRQRLAGNLSLAGWPVPWSLPEGWRTRRRLPWPL